MQKVWSIPTKYTNGNGVTINTVVDGWIVSFYRRIALRKVSHFVVSEKAWIPLVLFVTCFILCVLREVFDPSFIRMPEAVVFSVVVVLKALSE